MVYKQLAKFENKENYQLAKEWLKHLINSNEGSCFLDDERDHYENWNKEIKISLYHNKLEILAECLSNTDEVHLRELLQKKFGDKN